jgi:hypothetical protein
MRKLNALIAILLFAAPAFAQEQLSPAQALLRNLRGIRAGIEQEDEKDNEKVRAAMGQTAVVQEPGTSLGEMRWRVTDNVRNVREPFRCLDVDIEKNSAPVVLVCGANSGTAAAVENNQVNSGNRFYSTPAGLKR